MGAPSTKIDMKSKDLQSNAQSLVDQIDNELNSDEEDTSYLVSANASTGSQPDVPLKPDEYDPAANGYQNHEQANYDYYGNNNYGDGYH